ncbi:hypothetical protein ABPG75_003170 [Micractinium tetrahymenae]
MGRAEHAVHADPPGPRHAQRGSPARRHCPHGAPQPQPDGRKRLAVGAACLLGGLPLERLCLYLNWQLQPASLHSLAQLAGSLTFLDLGACQLAGLPRSLGALTTLRVLLLASGSSQLYPGRLERLPTALVGMTALTALDLSHQQLHRAGASWRQLAPLHALRRLALAGNGLPAVPEVLSSLPSLATLDLADNPLQAGWRHVAAARRLRSADLRGCGLHALPAELQGHPAAARFRFLGLLPWQ